MKKHIYISSDYSEDNGDREVVKALKTWGYDNRYKVEFLDMAEVVSGSVSENNPDCRPCDLKREFNQQINASSSVIFVVGDKTADRKAGSNCSRFKYPQSDCSCTPYKQNANGTKNCKVASTTSAKENVGNINEYSYLQHEFEQAKKRQKNIIIVYNSLRKESTWLPSYMKDYESCAQPFWIKNSNGEKVGDYKHIKQVLGYE